MLGLVRVISPFRCLGHTDIHQRSALSESSPLFSPAVSRTHRRTSTLSLVRVISPFPHLGHTDINARPCQSSPLSRVSKIQTCIKTRPYQSHLPFLCVSDTQDIRQCAALSESSPLFFYVSRTHKTYVNARPCRSHCPFLCVISCVSIPSSKPLATANRTDVSEDS